MRRALPPSLSLLPLAAGDPIFALAAKVGEKATAVQNRPTFPVEALIGSRPDGLKAVDPASQAKGGAFASSVDRILDRRTRVNRNRARRARLFSYAG